VMTLLDYQSTVFHSRYVIVGNLKLLQL
jgi:hypothetical protein